MLNSKGFDLWADDYDKSKPLLFNIFPPTPTFLFILLLLPPEISLVYDYTR